MVNLLNIFDQLTTAAEGNSIQYLFLIGILLFILIIVVAIVLCARSLKKANEIIPIKVKKHTQKIESLFIEDELIEENIVIPQTKLNLEEITKDMRRKMQEATPIVTNLKEEETIISYNELVQDITKKEPIIEIIEDEIIDDNILPNENLSSFTKAKEMVNDTLNKIPAKFKPSQIISPVFGINQIERREGENLTATLLDTGELTKITEEIIETDDFLKDLKAFRSSLD